jgi:hypothetical protein
MEANRGQDYFFELHFISPPPSAAASVENRTLTLSTRTQEVFG